MDKEQIISGFIDAVKKYDVVQYSVNYKINDFSKGANTYIYKCFEKYNPMDSAVGCLYNLKSDETHCVYTGEEFNKYTPKFFGEGVVCTYNRKNNPEDFGDQKIDIAGTKAIAPSVLSSHFLYSILMYRLVKYFGIDSNVQKCTALEDSVINGVDCYRIGYKWRQVIAFDKKTFLPFYHLEPFSNQNREAFFTGYKIYKGDSRKLFSRKVFPKTYKFLYNPPRLKKKELSMNIPVPNWELMTIYDKKINLHDLKGKPLLLIFSEIGCVPCMAAIPDLNDIAKKYTDINLLAVYPLDSKEALLKFSKEKKYAYDILYNSKETAKNYYVTGYPTFFLIDKNGILKESFSGYGDGTKKEIKKKIEKLLELN
jgi:thiol-disulfide isomerase/thioredoxin